MPSEITSPPGPVPSSLAERLSGLERHRPVLTGLSDGEIRRAWSTTLERLLGRSPDMEALRDALSHRCALSRAGLDAGLENVLRGAGTPAALDLFAAARRAAPGPAIAILASNLPGLAVQSVLPALAVRRPLMVKSASAEPLFAPALLRVLGEELPATRRTFTAVTWTGGDEAVERGLFAEAERIVAYGGGDAVASLRRRVGDKLIAHGPKFSVAWVSRRTFGPRLPQVATGLARDIALFDQRGCLSIQAVMTDGDPQVLSDALADALVQVHRRWPPGADSAAASAARQARDSAIMRGRRVAAIPLDAGTVITEPDGAELEPSPGYRTVSILGVADVDAAHRRLAPWRGQLQGLAVADPGVDPRPLEARLKALGVSHIAPPGHLQSVDAATWQNGGVAPVDAFL